MVLNKYTGSILMDGNEDDLFKVFGNTMKTFATYVYLKTLQLGDSIRIRAYNKVDDVSRYKLDGDVNDSVGTNNGTVTNISSWLSQWKFDSNVNDSIGSNNGTITYNSNLKRLYKFESNLNDSTGNANASLTAGTATYVTGQEGNCISFNGSTYASASDSGLPTGAGNISVTCWIKANAFTGSPAYFSYGNDGAHTTFALYTSSSGVIGFYDGAATIVISNTTLVIGQWYHVSVTYNGTNMLCYINGVLDKTTAVTVNTTLGGASGEEIGSYAGTAMQNSYMDELRVYNITLSAAQVSALYMNGKFGQSHTFDGSSGITSGEYIQFGSASTWDFLSNSSALFSISFWIKHTGNGLIFDTSSWGASTGILIATAGSSYLDLVIVNSTGAVVVQSNNSGMAPVQDGRWHHVVWTHNQSLSSANTNVYLDGVLVDTQNKTANAPSTPPTNALTLGARSNGSQNEPFGGQLDEVRIYNSILSASQVLGLYNYTGSNFISPLPQGNSILFNGSTYVAVPNQTPYNFERTNSFSISKWIKTTSSSGTLISNLNLSSNDQGYELGLTGGSLYFELINNFGTNNYLEVTTNNTFNDGNWHNVVVTYNGNSNVSGVTIYVDNVSQTLTTVKNSLSASIISNSNLSIGGRNNGTVEFSGLLDEVQIYNYVLSSAEIFNIYAGRFGNTHPIGLWHFDGDLYDYSGQGSTGIPTGTIEYVTGALSGSYTVPNEHFNFDGSETISVTSNSNLSFEYTNPFTFSFWGKFTNTSTIGILGKTATGLGGNGYWLYFASGKLNIQIVNINNTNDIAINATNTNNDGLLHNFVITYNGNGIASGVIMYVDGVAVAMTTQRNNLAGKSIANTQNLVIGGLTVSDLPLTAEIDDVRIINRALSAGEVLDLYTYPDSPMKELVYDRTYSGVKSDLVYVPTLQGNQYKVTCQQISGTHRIIPWEREEYV